VSFPRYPAYKPSGVEWLGEVPDHWEITKLGRICKFESGKAHEPFIDDEGGFICVNSRFISTEGKTVKNCRENLSPALRDDVLAVMSDLPNGRALGKAFFVEEDRVYAVNQRVCRLTPVNVSPRLLFWLVNRNPGLLWFDDGVNQTHIPNSGFTKLIVALPGNGEQSLIASFLDRETAKIDALIAEQQRLIELLQEKRQAVISHAVTKGLNPEAPMKDSGVEWLGEVPEHWEVKPLKHLCEIYSGFPFRSDLFQSDGIPVVRMSNISGGTIDLQDAVFVPKHEVPPEALIRAGDLLLGLSGSVGNFGIATDGDLPAAVNQRVALIRTSNPILKHFLGSPLFSDQVTCGLPSTTIANVSASQLGNCLLALPPLNEQEHINEFLSDFESGSVGLGAAVESSISLMQERRSALISAAVTGQIDVRGLVTEEAA
jgi:type I restriction enzyme S subunit